ncbi:MULTISPECIES: DUF1002 domain-containing protein [unclassified Sporosarcina]|uniref:DUF1002 domain-containing protein n=1 Tax=unclassified Sporosarcina TaxID=2647733 RepID=UPI000C173190|nr:MULTISPECIES: DUF1002 domain-containing protein [unclassified Sporosarcina]PIC99684.1 hypothetical protein CSV68_06130 [Sporosarcina sp. P29]PID06176.1 hypothetical protein CSV66_06650 [Sporosarcina sp. P30]PID09370.1 hypothetical protein CSV65_06650 [Sporosarcina sp. P31]PID12669.1 hypothetical protein CSV64_06115 [Sporosarcina sp. P32b]
MKKGLASLLAFMMMVAIIAPTAVSADEVINEKLGVPIVVYGSNLSDSEKASVKESLTVANEAEVEELSVDGNDLIKYIPGGDRNARMYSSAKITRQEEGEGLVINIVTPDNITQVTADMYATAMLTAGIEDAVVEVASPKKVTGHSALVGIYKAYEVSGEVLDTERTDVANDELSLATKLSEKAGVDQDEVAKLLTEIKKQISEQKPATKEDVEQIVQDQLQKFNIELSEADRQLLIDLMDRISKLDIDFSKLNEQLSDMASKIKDKLGDIDPSFWEKVKEFFRNMADSLKSLFS